MNRTAAGRPRPAPSALPRRTRLRQGYVRGLLVDAERHIGRTGRPHRSPGARPAVPAAGGPRRPGPRGRCARRPGRPGSRARWRGPRAPHRAGPPADPPHGRWRRPGRSPGPCRAARRWRARSRRRPGPRTARQAAPGSGRPAGASSGWRRSPRACPSPVSRAALSTASRMISIAGISPPSSGAYEVGSTWISSQPEPSATSSWALSRTRRVDVLGGPQAGPGDVVEPLETEPAALVGRPQFRWLTAGQRVGEVDPVLVGEFEQGGGPHRPGEVQVQVGLGQQTYITLHRKILPHGRAAAEAAFLFGVGPGRKEPPAEAAGAHDSAGCQALASPSSFWSRETPSMRSSSPSA
ncbi:hypothetical protein SMICM17S_04006 [Streptomyces microflavus]